MTDACYLPAWGEVAAAPAAANSAGWASVPEPVVAGCFSSDLFFLRKILLNLLFSFWNISGAMYTLEVSRLQIKLSNCQGMRHRRGIVCYSRTPGILRGYNRERERERVIIWKEKGHKKKGQIDNNNIKRSMYRVLCSSICSQGGKTRTNKEW